MKRNLNVSPICIQVTCFNSSITRLHLQYAAEVLCDKEQSYRNRPVSARPAVQSAGSGVSGRGVEHDACDSRPIHAEVEKEKAENNIIEDLISRIKYDKLNPVADFSNIIME